MKINQKYEELWFAWWRRCLKLIHYYDTKIVSPKSNAGNYYAWFNFSGVYIDISISLKKDKYDGYSYYVGYKQKADYVSDTIVRITKRDDETNIIYKNTNNIDIKSTHMESISSLIHLHKTNTIDQKLDDICRYIHSFERMMDTTDYLKHLASARMFMFCSRSIFPRDIAKIIYKKIFFICYFLFFIFSF